MMIKVYFMMVKGGSFYEGPFLPMSTLGLPRHISGAFVVGNQIKHSGRELDLAVFGARRNFKYCWAVGWWKCQRRHDRLIGFQAGSVVWAYPSINNK